MKPHRTINWLITQSTLLGLAAIHTNCDQASESNSKAENATALPMAVLLQDSGSDTYLVVALEKPATSLTVTKASGANPNTLTTPVIMQAASPLANGRSVFKSESPFSPTDGMMATITASADIHLEQKIQFRKKIPVDSATTVSEFGMVPTRRLTVVGSATDGLATPRDLGFNPERPTELWTVNKDSEGVVIFFAAGTATQRSEKRTDAYSKHFMSKVSSLAFGLSGTFATCHESRNEARPSPNFMGPTLWSTDLSIFAQVNQQVVEGALCDGVIRPGSPEILQGSHLDMLHQSPLCAGIAYAGGSAYWAFDGANRNLVYYDFVKDHGPGRSDHSDGRVRRYRDVNLTMVTGVVSHMKVDPASGLLYIADTGTGRLLRVDPRPATAAEKLSPHMEPLAEYVAYVGAKVDTLVQGLRQPAGLTINGKKLFVADHATGEIIAYNIDTGAELGRMATGAKKIMGLTISPDKKLWFVDAGANTVVRVDP